MNERRGINNHYCNLRTRHGQDRRQPRRSSSLGRLPLPLVKYAPSPDDCRESRLMKPIYLDYNATTPIDPAVLEAMLPYLEGRLSAIPPARTPAGKRAHEAVENARASVAGLLGAQADEIVFTGGGTEASNHAIKGAVFACLQGGLPSLLGRWFGRSLRSPSGHQRRRAPRHGCSRAQFLRRLGCRVTVVPVNGQGVVDPDDVRPALDRRHRPRQHHALQQRGRHAAADQGDRRPGTRRAACCCTPTPPSRWARCR